MLIPSKDRLDSLLRTVESVRRQGFSSFEVIVSDNASEVPYDKAIASLADDRIRSVRLDDHVPVAQSWNHALSHARGEYVILLSDADALAPGYFQLMSDLATRWHNPDVVHAAAYFYHPPTDVPSEPGGDFYIGLDSLLFVGVFDPYLLSPKQARSLASAAMRLHRAFSLNVEHFLWKRSAMPTIARSEEFFRSPSPHIFAAMMTFLNAENIVVQPRPGVIIGRSHCASAHPISDAEPPASSVFPGDDSAATDCLPDPDLLPGPADNTNWLLAAKAVQDTMEPRRFQVGVKRYRHLQIVHAVRRAGPGREPDAVRALWPLLRSDERLAAKGVLAALRLAGWHRPGSQGTLILGKLDQILNQYAPPEVTQLPIGNHRTILDAISWLEGSPAGLEIESTGQEVPSLNPYLSLPQQKLTDGFHHLYYSLMNEGHGVGTIALKWLGHSLFKCPLDLWLYQELISADRPDVIVETGTYRGGSAHYMATICDLIGHGRVVTIDVDPWSDVARPRHKRLSYLTGSSTDPAIVAKVRNIIGSSKKVLVILDSDHSFAHVLAELRIYEQFVAVGGLLIVEDTNVNGHPTFLDHGPGPSEAVDAFLTETPDFIADRGLERFLLTMNPRGYLRRVAESSEVTMPAGNATLAGRAMRRLRARPSVRAAAPPASRSRQ